MNAVSNHVSKACEKLRHHERWVQSFLVMVSKKQDGFRHSRRPYSIWCQTAYPTQDTSVVLAAAQRGLKCILQPKATYLKAGVMLVCMKDAVCQSVMFQPTAHEDKMKQLMSTIDGINKDGNNQRIFFASQGTGQMWRKKGNDAQGITPHRGNH